MITVKGLTIFSVEKIDNHDNLNINIKKSEMNWNFSNFCEKKKIILKIEEKYLNLNVGQILDGRK